MANTERLQVLRRVREAKMAAREARERAAGDEVVVLNGLLFQLEVIEDELIVTELTAAVDSLTRHSESLAALAGELEGEVERLADLAAAIRRAAEALRALASITAAAASAGLL